MASIAMYCHLDTSSTSGPKMAPYANVASSRRITRPSEILTTVSVPCPGCSASITWTRQVLSSTVPSQMGSLISTAEAEHQAGDEFLLGGLPPPGLLERLVDVDECAGQDVGRFVTPVQTGLGRLERHTFS